MPNTLKKFSCLAFLLCPLTIGYSAQAQTGNDSSAFEQSNELEQQGMARQEIREEMQRIRTDHENIESEHDALRVQCLNAKGQERSACHQKWEALTQQRGALHERMKALHEKIAVLRQERRSSVSDEHHAMNNRDQPMAAHENGPAGGPMLQKQSQNPEPTVTP